MSMRTHYRAVPRQDFLANRAVQVANAQAHAAAHPEQNIIVIDAGDEVICDLCNAEVEDQMLYLCRHGVHCVRCKKDMSQEEKCS